jgi:prephenate dehydrogenase (NADP+)
MCELLSFDLYEKRFLQTAEFFKPRFEDAANVGSSMIQAIMEDAREAEEKGKQ